MAKATRKPGAAWSWKCVRPPKPAPQPVAAPLEQPAPPAPPVPLPAEPPAPPAQVAPPAPTPQPAAPAAATGGRGLGWAPEWEDKLRELWPLMSAGDCATRLTAAFPTGHFTRSGVLGKVMRLGLTLPEGAAKRRMGHSRANARRSAAATLQHKPAPLRFGAPPSLAPLPARRPLAPPPLPPDAAPIAIDQLTAASCRWPIDPTEEHGWRYCGAPRSDNPTYCYCPYHLGVVLAPPKRAIRRVLRAQDAA